MSEGYKNTPIGKIPKDWEVENLGSFLDYVQPKNYITNNINETGKTPVLTANKAFILGFSDEIENIYNDVPVIIFDDFTTDSKFVNFPFKVRSSALKILKRKNKNFNLPFVFESLKRINYQCTEHKRYWISEYQHLKIPVPPLPEQQKIADILSTVDAKIAVIDQQITETQALKKSLMQRLLTKGIGHTEFKDSPLGKIPKSWEVVKLGNLVTKVGSGKTPKGGSEIYTDKGIIFIRSQNVLRGKLNLSDVVFISNEIHSSMNNSKLQPNDVLLNITGASIGRSCVLPNDFKEGNVNQHVCIIRTKSRLNPHYLSQLLNSSFGVNSINKFQAGGNREGLNFQQIRSFDIPFPVIEEQDKISNILSSVDEKLEVLSEKKTHYQELKQGLMQQLLTGKIRVKTGVTV
ncbi:type I restriction enzyme S subunit [Mariniflexile fucanivorans]|uniref:Type I restriction enzyme S subunit n=1 Tax=Mariniflexile fucanivorans TaxID=264023 RepID=A0A4R1RNK9_9FLAO|nr:restriction endonuclease subunit S [Mariniflexile fucanivorans]TCL67510.1 type I restriction enzyme S subunit [Mariniflexile fucanivorans]